MRMIILVIWLIISQGHLCKGQHLIGIEKNQVNNIVKKELSGFNLDNSTQNKEFNYLRFVNRVGTITLFVFFDQNNISTSTRMVCDYSELGSVLGDLDAKYKKRGQNNWEYSVHNELFMVNLEKKEWYFVVAVKKKPAGTTGTKRLWWWKQRN